MAVCSARGASTLSLNNVHRRSMCLAGGRNAPLGAMRSRLLQTVCAQPDRATDAPAQEQQQPGTPQPEELPIWVRREQQREAAAAAAGKGELPWPLYLLFSCFVAIASVGSVFEYVDRNPIFGIVSPDSPLWAPILGLFALTGLPTAGFLFFKGVNAANEAAEQQDRMDGYIK